MKTYLGDSVYAECNGYAVTLTTENGYSDDPRNIIILEPEAFRALVRFMTPRPDPIPKEERK